MTTYTIGGSTGVNDIYINQQLLGLAITNEIQGSVSINNITLNGTSQLGQTTRLLIQLTTNQSIPSGSLLTITLPTNFQLKSPTTVILNNQVAINAAINVNTFTITLIVIPDQQKNFNILINAGLTNPKTGPYSYSQFSFQFTYLNYAVDYVLSNQTWVDVQCGGNCTSCNTTLSGCQTCGIINNQEFFLYNNTCQTVCQKGYYAGAGYQCLPCSSPCLECSVGSEMCTKCDPKLSRPYVDLNTLSCYSQCPTGTYLNTSLNQCVACSLPCYSCTSSTTCLTCDSSNPENQAVYLYSQNSSCLNQCPDVTVPAPSRICVDCEAPCKTCLETPDNCLTCTAGLYFYKNQCVSSCPFNYYSDNTLMKCKAIASLKIPFPFTIIALVVSIGVGLASFMKGNHKTGQGTAFFITCLAFVDILLRVNWFVFGILALQQGYYYIFYGCVIVLTMSMFLNLGVWRRFFKFKYNIDENDRLFVKYSKSYPRTSKWIIFVSFLFTFQAFRLTYSRLLGKKQFCAEFTRSRLYYRLIGRLSIMEIMLVYIPGLALNAYGFLFQFKMGDQIFYIGLDSLTLVGYATVLIVITLTQREKLIDQKDLFKWGELCRCSVPSDDEKMYDNELEDGKKGSPVKVMATFEDSQGNSPRMTQHLDEIELDVMSATGFHDIKRQKRHLYQTEQREQIKQKDFVAPVNQLDYNQYRNLEEKVNRIVLKRNLFENRRMNDYNDLQDRRSDLTGSLSEQGALLDQLDKLKRKLLQLQSTITQTKEEKQIDIDVVKQRKREEIVKRNQASDTSQHPFTLNSVQGSVSTPHQHIFNFELHHSTEGDFEPKHSKEDSDEEQDGPKSTQIITTQTNPNLMLATTESQEEEEDKILREYGQQRQSFGPNVNSTTSRDV